MSGPGALSADPAERLARAVAEGQRLPWDVRRKFNLIVAVLLGYTPAALVAALLDDEADAEDLVSTAHAARVLHLASRWLGRAILDLGHLIDGELRQTEVADVAAQFDKMDECDPDEHLDARRLLAVALSQTPSGSRQILETLNRCWVGEHRPKLLEHLVALRAKMRALVPVLRTTEALVAASVELSAERGRQ